MQHLPGCEALEIAKDPGASVPADEFVDVRCFLAPTGRLIEPLLHPGACTSPLPGRKSVQPWKYGAEEEGPELQRLVELTPHHGWRGP